MTQKSTTQARWVAVSGGFDPLHVGHVRLMRAARALGEKLVVIVNNDNWLRLKKGFTFMPESERVELISALSFVDKVVLTDHTKHDSDMSVVRTLRTLKPQIFANGGDRGKDNTPEAEVCRALGIEMQWGVGAGGKVQSSSWMIRASRKLAARTQEAWGARYDWDEDATWSLSTIDLAAGASCTLSHKNAVHARWILLEGDATVTEEGGNLHHLEVGVPYGNAEARSSRISSKRGALICETAFSVPPESASG